ncbi:MAG: hypothetical protein AAF533_02170 [Acidobacteriota bacterium]
MSSSSETTWSQLPLWWRLGVTLGCLLVLAVGGYAGHRMSERFGSYVSPKNLTLSNTAVVTRLTRVPEGERLLHHVVGLIEQRGWRRAQFVNLELRLYDETDRLVDVSRQQLWLNHAGADQISFRVVMPAFREARHHVRHELIALGGR